MLTVPRWLCCVGWYLSAMSVLAKIYITSKSTSQQQPPHDTF